MNWLFEIHKTQPVAHAVGLSPASSSPEWVFSHVNGPGGAHGLAAVVLAVLARHGGVSLSAADVFVNVAGGIRIEEPAFAVDNDVAGIGRFDQRPVEPLAFLQRFFRTPAFRDIISDTQQLDGFAGFIADRLVGPGDP